MAAGKKGEKMLTLGTRLKYPIRITRLYKNPGDAIRRQEPVLQYSFDYTMELPQDRSTLALQTRTLTSITDWNAPEDGVLLDWRVRVGDTVTRDQPACTVEEACTHEIQFQGLCALCGQDMNEVNWASEQRGIDRAPINMTHDQTSLTVSHSAAARAENELQARLLRQRKLSLVVDLDQTIIHACFDPTIGEWQQDPANPNYAALRDVQKFQLESPGALGPAARNWYYIKMRPGLASFLAAISKLYELHVYTMGTRSYATNIARIVDPDQRLFGNRVISRDENGNIVAKSLQRLFPVSTHMAVIIDDRADVWPYNRHNLIKVTPYDFFKGTGDINSSFLPKRSDLGGATDEVAPTPAVAAVAAAEATPSVADDKPADAADKPTLSREELATLQRQAEEQERTIAQQIQERPLLHMQQKLDEAEQSETQEAEAAAAAASSSSGSGSGSGSGSSSTTVSTTPPPQQQHAVLFDDDDELEHLQAHLTKLHRLFYEEYDKKKAIEKDATVPDVSTILDRIKGEVLKDTVIVLSGLVPLGMAVEQSEIGLQLLSFGARLNHHVSRATTHLVISSDRPRTQKVRQAAKFPDIHIVRQDWLAACFAQWARVAEGPYLVPVHPADRRPAGDNGASHTGKTDGHGNGTDTDTMSEADSETAANGEDENDGNGGNDGNDGLLDSDGSSPIAELGTFDWGAADDELEMFLAEEGDDDDDDDDEGGEENEDEDRPVSAKRKHDDEGSAAGASNGRLLTVKRQRRGASPSRSASRTRADVQGADAKSEDDDDDELEAMLMAELDEEEEEAAKVAKQAVGQRTGG